MNIEYKTGTLLILDSNIADHVVKKFKANYLWAKEKYTGKKFLISGIIDSLKPNPNNKRDVLFEEDYICIRILIPYLRRKLLCRRILCYMKYGKDFENKIAEGIHITLKGKLDFDCTVNDLVFSECEVVRD
ncbi:hypothetical protein P0136_02890 [Lentisphaerota bacterium ZTH]|nr:hypothetical protein JYG24_05970 [Lentisphaerota bacterium]WET06948.1 hypothetical protein P0136_02890 [Lentisphaerota bacterium ZTH]